MAERTSLRAHLGRQRCVSALDCGALALWIKDWNIWHSYSTYFLRPVPDLLEAGRKLVASNLAALAFVPESWIWHRLPDGLVAGDSLMIDRRPYHPQALVTFPKTLTPYAFECAYQAAMMDVIETHLLWSPTGHPPNYLRAFLTECRLQLENWEVNLYPQIKLYEGGVLIVHLRVVAADTTCDLDAFIEDHVNLFQHVANSMEIPPSLLRWYARSMLNDRGGGFLGPRRFLRLLDRWIARKTEVKESGDFSYPFVPVDDPDLQELLRLGPEPLGLRYLGRMIERCTAEVLLRGRTSWLRAVSIEDVMGSFWSGRPSVHLISFEDQPLTKSGTSPSLKLSLAKIMSRTGRLEIPNVDTALGRDLRAYEDYAAFMNKALTLWAYTGNALSQKGDALLDRNYGQLVYDKQSQVEYVDYRYMCHRQLEERSLMPHSTIRDVVNQEREIVQMRTLLTTSSPFGELVDIFRHADECLGLGEIRDHIRENLRLKSMVMEETRASNTRRFGWILSLLLGLGTASTLANSVVRSIWSLLRLPVFEPKIQGLVDVGVAFGFLVCIVVLAWRLTVGRRVHI